MAILKYFYYKDYSNIKLIRYSNFSVIRVIYEKTNPKFNLFYRKIKEKERVKFYEYAFESSKENLTTLGVSFSVLRKFCTINRFLLGLPSKLLMRGMKDYFVEKNGKIVAGYTIIKDKNSSGCELANLFTRSEFQGKGIGNCVMKRIIDDHGDTKITLGVDQRNQRAIHLYKKYEFKVKSIMKEYVVSIPFTTKPIPKGFSIRRATREDLARLADSNDIVDANPEKLVEKYRNSFNKTKKRKIRLNYELPMVLLHKNNIIGIAKARWTKGTPHTAFITVDAISESFAEVYPCFIEYIAKELQKMEFTKFLWTMNESTVSDLFYKEIKPFIGEPWRVGFKMERKSFIGIDETENGFQSF
jgi:ribosomal protein S18 acetylase RimI-like enzyme